MHSVNSVALILPVVAMMIPIILVPTVLGFRHARFERQLEHAERIKALEVGRPLSQDEPWWTPARLCVAIGVGVPLGALFAAWGASASLGHHDATWIATGLVGLAGVVGGTRLAAYQLAARIGAGPNAETSFSKPYVDADAFDVAGSRG